MPMAEYEAGHIPGARFFDIDDISDHRSDLPHMAPPVEKFMSRLRAMGVGDGHQVVVYDGAGPDLLLHGSGGCFASWGKRTLPYLDGGHARSGRPKVVRSRICPR